MGMEVGMERLGVKERLIFAWMILEDVGKERERGPWFPWF